MKKEITIKYIKNNFENRFFAEYCDLQYIMTGHEAEFYNAGVYGWNCDVYIDYTHNIAITTGYRNMTGERIPDELIEKHTNIPKAICKGFTNWTEVEKHLEQNRKNFFAELAKI